MIVVIMNKGNVSQEAAPGEGSAGFFKPSFALSQTMDGQFEETFGDIMRFVEGNYRIKATKASRAIAGLSTGNYYRLIFHRTVPTRSTIKQIVY